MSVKFINHVWEHSKQKGSELLLMLAIADNADDDDGHCYPSLQTLAKKTRMSERQIQRLLKKLEKNGELFVRWGGRGRHQVNHYYITLSTPAAQSKMTRKITLLDTLPKGDKMSPLQPAQGVKLSPLRDSKGDIAESNDPVVDVVGGGRGGMIDTVLNLFCNLKGGDYEFSQKDIEHLSQLFAEGYTHEQIIQGITVAFELTSKPKRFVQCARITRQRFSPSGIPETGTPAFRNANIQNAVTENRSVNTTHPELASAIDLYRRLIKRDLNDDDVLGLNHLMALCDDAAKRDGERGAAWLSEALGIALTSDEPVKSPLRYAERILRNWMEHGKGSDVRPTREGYRPQRKANKSESPVEDSLRGKYLNLGGY